MTTAAPVRVLRDYQLDAVRAVRERQEAGLTTLAGVAATGLGKSSIAGQVACQDARAGRKVLMLGHRAELLDQLGAAVRAIDPGVPVGRIQAGTNRLGCPVTVAMIDTVRRPARWPRLENYDSVVYDEVHHAAAPANLRFLTERLGVGQQGGAQLLGLTATLTRSDRHGLAQLFPDDEHVAFRYGIGWAIEHGWLVRPRARAVVADHVDLKAAKISAGDYQAGELGRMVAQDVDQIVTAWIENAVAPDGQYVPGPAWSSHYISAAFLPDVASAGALADAFLARGIPAEVVTGTTPAGVRGDAERGTGIYGRLARGETRVLCSVMVPTEGWDCPPVGCIIQGRPTRYAGLYQQMVGRALRLADPATWPVLAAPKTDALILDVVGAAWGQQLSTLVDLVPSAVVDLSELGERPEVEPGTGALRSGPDALVGPAVYEDIDLLMAESAGGAWLATLAGHPFLISEERAAVIFREEAGTYRVGSVALRGPIDALKIGNPNRGLTLDQARHLAEQWCIRRRPYLASKGAAWRTRSKVPTMRDQRRAQRLDIDPRGRTGRELAEAIDIALVSGRVDRLGPGAAARRAEVVA